MISSNKPPDVTAAQATMEVRFMRNALLVYFIIASNDNQVNFSIYQLPPENNFYPFLLMMMMNMPKKCICCKLKKNLICRPKVFVVCRKHRDKCNLATLSRCISFCFCGLIYTSLSARRKNDCPPPTNSLFYVLLHDKKWRSLFSLFCDVCLVTPANLEALSSHSFTYIKTFWILVFANLFCFAFLFSERRHSSMWSVKWENSNVHYAMM